MILQVIVLQFQRFILLLYFLSYFILFFPLFFYLLASFHLDRKFFYPHFVAVYQCLIFMYFHSEITNFFFFLRYLLFLRNYFSLV